jgi:hypothetical protein
MIKPAGFSLGTSALGLAFAALAGAKDLPVPAHAIASTLPAETSAWPWIAVTGLLVTLGAIALVSRRRMPFGKPR